jgi:hypothetical protein
VDISISFRLKPNVKKVVGLVATLAPRGSDKRVAKKNTDCVQILLHLVSVSIYAQIICFLLRFISTLIFVHTILSSIFQVDPECAVKISNQRVDVLAALHSTSEEDFIVLFFVWINKVKNEN